MKIPHHHLSFNNWRKTMPVVLGLMLCTSLGFTQTPNKSIIDAIVKEETDNSQVQKLAHELFDESARVWLAHRK
jgi:carboxypeptidase Q